MTGRKIRMSERWKGRQAPRPKAVVALAPTSTPIAVMPSPPPIPAAEPLSAADRARIARWVALRIVTWAPDNCFHCRRPIVFGAKWVELVNDNERARFHFDCEPAWRAQQVALARRAMGLGRSERK
jgi:hypothetical protein